MIQPKLSTHDSFYSLYTHLPLFAVFIEKFDPLIMYLFFIYINSIAPE